MERMTERYEHGDLYVKEHDYISDSKKLAEYEDTGLTPEQIVKLQEQNAILKELLRATAEDAKGLFNACGEEYDKHDDISEPENCKFCKSYSDGGCKMNHECKWRYADKVEGVLKDE
ncbi:MAG: hypothetical protein ACLUV3_00860 [Oscillospiraceae bacterium]